MPQVLNWQAASLQPASLVETCVKALKAGQLVGIPTESCYFVVGDATIKSVPPKMAALLGAEPKYPILEAFPPQDKPETLFAGGSTLARRFARRILPGPAAICTPIAKNAEPVIRYIPNSQASRAVMQGYGKPLAFGGILTPDDEAVTTIEQFQSVVGEAVACVVDVGKTHFGDLPSIVEVEGNSYRVAIEGVVKTEDFDIQSCWFIAFVCTGNTCRSPLAEAICKKMFASRLECEIEELPSRGIRVTSMGISAMRGNTATPEALIVAREMKADLSAHRSRELRSEILELADYVLAMTRIHRDSLVAIHPPVEGIAKLLCGTSDLSDPIGGDLAVYRTCAKTMEKHLEKLVNDVLTIGPPVPEE